MPKGGTSPFVAYVIGPPGLERMVIKDNRGQRPRYFTGLRGQRWTDDLREALQYSKVDDLSADLQEIHIEELGHRGVTRYALDLDVTVIGDATSEQVRQYLFDALTIGLDYRHHGDGPTEDSLVMVRTDTSSLRPLEVLGQDWLATDRDESEFSTHRGMRTMAKKKSKQPGEFEGALCARCELPLDSQEGTCPNDRCPYHFGFQDEVVDDGGWPTEEERRYIEQVRKRLDEET